MGMTITEKILARASGKDIVNAGEIINVEIDWLMSNDATTHISIDIFNNRIKKKQIYNNEKIIFVIDHNVPAESEKTAHCQNIMRDFSRKYNIKLHDGEGVCHQLMLENYVNPGELVLAADSHTCSMGALGAFGAGIGSTDFVAAMVTGKTWLMVPETIRYNLSGKFKNGVYVRDLMLNILGDIKADGATYMTMEFGGSAVGDLTIDDRVVLTNLSIEAGAKNGIIEADERTVDYIAKRGLRETIGNIKKENYIKTNDYIETEERIDESKFLIKSDPDCRFKKIHEYDLSTIEPGIAFPHAVDRYCKVKEVEDKKIKINQGFIDSCNNGRIEELRVAAEILSNERVKKDIRLIISPASNSVYEKALSEGLIEIFLESGAMVVNPNCSVCWGACQGVIGKGETMISTGTRNFKGRAGSPDSKIYLASAATVAASCIEGIITDPRKYKCVQDKVV